MATSGDDKTAALVVALSAQLTKFEQDMKKADGIAGDTVSSIEDRFAKANPVFGGSFLGNFLANLSTKALDLAVKTVEDLIARFIELEKVAHLTGESLNDLFGFQQAAAQFKVPVDEATSSIKNLGALLDGLQRGEKNTLSQLFADNPLALQGVNVQALTLQQTLGIVADLIANARTEFQKIDIARLAGQADSMVAPLERGGEAFLQIAKNAAATAPDLQKIADNAKVFDDAWRTAVTNVKAYLAEHFFDSLKEDIATVITLLGGLVRFGSLLKGGLLNVESEVASIDKFKNSLIEFQKVRGQVDESAGLNLSKSARNDSRDGVTDQVNNQTGTSTHQSGAPLTNVPSKNPAPSTSDDSFDRTLEQITKHTAAVNADTIAVSQNNSVQAQLRAEFQLLNAIRKSDGEVTEEQVAQYEKLRVSLSAEQALEQAHIQLSPAHKAAFISASEGARQATESFDAAREAVSKLNSASSQIGSALSSAFSDAIVEGKALSDVVSSLVKTLEKAAINSIFGSIFNAPSSGGLSPFASLFKGIIPGFAGGTNSAPGGLAWVGEKGPELLNLPRGSQVIPNARAGGGGGPILVNVLNAPADTSASVRKSTSANGGVQIDVMLDSIVAKNVTDPGSASSRALDARKQLARR